MGLDVTIVIFLLKCGLHENMPLNIPGINAKSKQTEHLSTRQEEFVFLQRFSEPSPSGTGLPKRSKEDVAVGSFSLGTSEKFPWSFWL